MITFINTNQHKLVTIAGLPGYIDAYQYHDQKMYDMMLHRIGCAGAAPL
jgi:hypothetical protein